MIRATASATWVLKLIPASLRKHTVSYEHSVCYMGIKNNTNAILGHAPPSPLRLPHITGIKNNTHATLGYAFISVPLNSHSRHF